MFLVHRERLSETKIAEEEQTMRFIGTMIIAATVTVMGAAAQTNTVDQRRENQQDRVAQGIKSGQLTAGETGKLETKEAAFFFSSRRRHTRCLSDWSSDVCSSD